MGGHPAALSRAEKAATGPCQKVGFKHKAEKTAVLQHCGYLSSFYSELKITLRQALRVGETEGGKVELLHLSFVREHLH